MRGVIPKEAQKHTIFKPNGAELRLDGLWHKVGRHGLVFIWAEDSWIKSSKTEKEIRNAIKTEKSRLIREKTLRKKGML